MGPDKAGHPVRLPVHTLTAVPAVAAADFKEIASLGSTSRPGMRKGSSDLLVVKDGTTFVLFVCVDFSCCYCVFTNQMRNI